MKFLWNWGEFLIYSKLFTVQQIFVDILSSKDMSWKHLQHVFSVTILRLPRRLGRRKIVTPKTSWRRLEDMYWRRLEGVLKTCLEDVVKTCLEDVLKTLCRQAKYLLWISVSNKYIFNKSTFDNSKANPKYNNPSFQYLSYFGTQATSLFQELKSLTSVWCCDISWIQIRHYRKGEAIKTNF